MHPAILKVRVDVHLFLDLNSVSAPKISEKQNGIQYRCLKKKKYKRKKKVFPSKIKGFIKGFLTVEVKFLGFCWFGLFSKVLKDIPFKKYVYTNSVLYTTANIKPM